MKKYEMFIGKSKDEVLAMIPKDTKVHYFESSKGIPQMMSLLGGEWKLYLSLEFDKATRRVKAK